MEPISRGSLHSALFQIGSHHIIMLKTFGSSNLSTVCSFCIAIYVHHYLIISSFVSETERQNLILLNSQQFPLCFFSKAVVVRSAEVVTEVTHTHTIITRSHHHHHHHHHHHDNGHHYLLIILLTECGHSIWGATRITPVSVSLHILAPTPPFTAGYLFLPSWLSLFNDWIHSHSESPKLTSTSSSKHQKKTIISSPELFSTSLTKLSSKVTQSSKPFSHICSPVFSQAITSCPTIPHFVDGELKPTQCIRILDHNSTCLQKLSNFRWALYCSPALAQHRTCSTKNTQQKKQDSQKNVAHYFQYQIPN